MICHGSTRAEKLGPGGRVAESSCGREEGANPSRRAGNPELKRQLGVHHRASNAWRWLGFGVLRPVAFAVATQVNT